MVEEMVITDYTNLYKIIIKRVKCTSYSVYLHYIWSVSIINIIIKKLKIFIYNNKITKYVNSSLFILFNFFFFLFFPISRYVPTYRYVVMVNDLKHNIHITINIIINISYIYFILSP